MKIGKYTKFLLMMACSFIYMYIAMFLNVDQFDHIMLSHTRTYMTFLMVSPMAIIMLLFMLSMFENKKKNAIIIITSVVLFASCYFLLRDQTTVKDIQYMKAMIPHHSSAILVSQQANLEDPETKKLAKEIIEAQKREIAEMKKIMYRLKQQE